MQKYIWPYVSQKEYNQYFLKEPSAEFFFFNSEAEHVTSMCYDFKSDYLLHLCIY